MCDFSRYGGPSNEWLAVEATLPVPPSVSGDDSILERRDATNERREAEASEAMKTLASKVELHDYSIPTRDGDAIEARSYRSVTHREEASPVYMHLHGGGFLFGTLSSEDATCARIASNTGVVVLNVNYRHTPEFTYPTAWNDAEDAFVWLHAHIDELRGDSQRIVVGGISAGAQLSASLVLRKSLGLAANNLPGIAGQVLMIPCLVHMDLYERHLARMKDASISSYLENENAPILPKSTIRMFLDLLKVQHLDIDDLMLNPGNASVDQVRGLPPTTFAIAGLDPLRDEGLLYAETLIKAG